MGTDADGCLQEHVHQAEYASHFMHVLAVPLSLCRWIRMVPPSPSRSSSSPFVQVDQNGASLTVSRFSVGGITWSSVSIPAPVSAPSPPAPASESPHPESSSRRMLLHASEPRPPVVFLSPPASHGDWSLPSENQPDGRPLGFRSLQASGSTCAPTIMRCATRVLPPHGRRGGQ